MYLNTFEQLYALHMLCLQFEHGVRRKGGVWTLYTPSYFIHAYFTFNSIYNYDWRTTFAGQTLDAAEWPQSGRNKPSEMQRILSLVDFCYDTLPDAQSRFDAHLKSHLSSIRLRDPLAELQHITDDRHTREFREAFILGFKSLYQGLPISREEHRRVVHDVLRFVYKVRCNIFHGEKTISMMQEPGQQKRLRILAAILLATNALFFDTAKVHTQVTPYIDGVPNES